MRRCDLPVRTRVNLRIRVNAGERELEAAAQDGARFDFSTVNRGAFTVDIEGPVAGERLKLDIVPILVIDAGIHGQTTIKEPGLFADLVTPYRVRLVTGWPLASGKVIRSENRTPIGASRRISRVAPARSRSFRHGRIDH